MASGPITSWEIDGETAETVSDFIFGGSRITSDGDCSHEIKRCLLLGRKVMTYLDSILKSRDITLPTKVRLVKAIVFPVVMYGCESWTVKNWCFELWCWIKLLRVPWTAKRSNQSILKETSPGCSLEGLKLKLKLQYFAVSWNVNYSWITGEVFLTVCINYFLKKCLTLILSLSQNITLTSFPAFFLLFFWVLPIFQTLLYHQTCPAFS